MLRPRLVAWIALGVPFAWLFAPALAGGSSFVFRDAAHFYHPLFEFIRGQWGAGLIPLWNPYDNLGTPLAADTTSSVFYPGKLLFALPLDYTRAYNLYILAHVALAAAGAYGLARRLGRGQQAAVLAALCYSFSGSVVCAHANVVFLVGAAWLPVALLLSDRMFRERSAAAAIGLGVVLALVVTGGDPQMAYHIGLLAALYGLILRRATRSDASGDSTAPLPLLVSARLTALAFGTGLLLAAVQLLPSWEATRESPRAAYDSPRSLYELADWLTREHDAAPHDAWYSALAGKSTSGHERAIYEFSVGPWRAIECLWPNAGGLQFPTYHRWLDLLPAEGRVWSASLYMGLIPLILGLSRFSVRRGAPARVQWMSWATLLAAIGSLGVYGPVWLVREVARWCGLPIGSAWGGEVGGLYWLMTVVLPGYVYFRYPAKLLVVASLGMSMLAAEGWDECWQRPSQRVPRAFAVLAVASFMLLVVVWAAWPIICRRLEVLPPNALFGPFDCRAAWSSVAGGLLQTALVAALAWFWTTGSARGRFAPSALLLLTAVELAAAQHPLVSYAPTAAWQQTPTAITAMNVPPLTARPRVYRDPACWNEQWRLTSSAYRQVEGLRWDRDTLMPKYNLPRGIVLVEGADTLGSLDYETFWAVARRHALPKIELPPPEILDLVGAEAAILPSSAAPTEVMVASDTVFAIRRSARPRAWIVHQAEVLPPLDGRSPALCEQRTHDILFPLEASRNWAQSAVVETTEAPVVQPVPSGSSATESCQVAVAKPARVEILARLASPGIVVLADAYYPGWRLTVESDGVEHEASILRTNRVMRGAALPAGTHRLVYEYRPAMFRWGAVISGLAVAALVGLMLARQWRRHAHASVAPVSMAPAGQIAS